MSKGQDQVIEAAQRCRDVIARLYTVSDVGVGDKVALCERLDKCAFRLERLKDRLFVKTIAGVRFTQPCLNAAEQVGTAVGNAAAVGSSEVADSVSALEKTVSTLEQKCLPTGGIVIT